MSKKISREPKCQWFLRCPNPATGTQPHPILQSVPICERCRELVAKLGTET